jgi:putative hydrolase of the HAD superfamily
MVDVYRQHAPRIEPYPGVRGMLARLKTRFRIGLVSDGYLAVQRRKLDALRLAPAFDAILLTDELGRDAWKPSPVPFRTIVERLGVAPSSAIYVADNPAKDFRGARAVGMATVRVRHADGLHVNIEPDDHHDAPDFELADVTALEQQLDHPP